MDESSLEPDPPEAIYPLRAFRSDTHEATPVTASATMAQQQSVVRPHARILYVDHEPQFRMLGKMVLVGSGYDVDTAANGAEAWTALQEVHYDLLITDHDMPRPTGLELATQARLAGMRLSIVLASASGEPLCDPTSSWLGLAARLPKPFSAGQLVETVEQVLRLANGTSESAETIISVLTHLSGGQSYPHGGINE